ncbi:selenoprotein M-like [Trichogramma pretiosum]|uniref:selenoprotein M-like n=1 Tax=Trichogramma pretiosum TaxID=7493 RepID=UPI0006C99B21|nr:selenoprotein M-like [Trichogramma pretiosum]
MIMDKVLLFFVVFSLDSARATENHYAYAVVESCRGCQLNRLPDIKSFIFEDLPKYEGVEFKHIQGVPPELVLYNNEEKEMERFQLAQLSRKECNDLLISKGFKKSVPAVKDEI